MSIVIIKVDVRLVFDGAPPEQEVLFDLAEAAMQRAIASGEFTGALPVKETKLWALSARKEEA